MKSAFLYEKKTRKALANFIVRTEKLSMGEKCFEFEKTFAKKQGRKDAVLFNSGGSANLAMFQALKNLGILKDGDKVGFSALTWGTNVMPIIQMGLEPVAIDCDPETLNVMSYTLAKRLESTELKALFITNALGFAGDLAKIQNICKKNGILLIEDNCEALGTKVSGQKTGNFGLAASFSFFVAHHLSTIEGGMVCTDDEKLSEMLRIVRANGWDRNLTSHQQDELRKKHSIESDFYAKYAFYELGFNLRPTEITGFLGLHQLKFLDENIKRRTQNYIFLEKYVTKNPDLIPLKHDHVSGLSPFGFIVLCKTPELKKKYLSRFVKSGVEVRPMIAGNIVRQPFYKKYGGDFVPLAGAEFLHTHSFYCGNYPELTKKDLKTIALCLKKDK